MLCSQYLCLHSSSQLQGIATSVVFTLAQVLELRYDPSLSDLPSKQSPCQSTVQTERCPNHWASLPCMDVHMHMLTRQASSQHFLGKCGTQGRKMMSSILVPLASWMSCELLHWACFCRLVLRCSHLHNPQRSMHLPPPRLNFAESYTA